MIFTVYQSNNYLRLSRIIIALIFILLSSWMTTAALSTTDQNLSSIENKLFEHDYPKEDDKQRLDRIENFVFGTTSNGSIQQRLDAVLKIMPVEEDEKSRI